MRIEKILIIVCLLIFPATDTNAFNLPLSNSGTAETPPNILLIFIDDMGWPAVSCLGNEHVKTPQMDRIAEEGMLFTDAYVNPQCTPSRASLLMGQHTARSRFWHVVGRYGYPYMRMQEPPYEENLSRDAYTLAEMLQDNGYFTAINGKWHLHTWNERYPDPDGYYTYLFENANDYYGWDYNSIPEDMHYTRKTDKGVDWLTDEAIRSIEMRGEKPFFIYLSQHTIHGPVLAPEKLIKKYLAKGYPAEGVHNATYLAAIEHLDHAVGRLLKYLDRKKLTENTLVIFLTDNGGVDMEFSNAPLRFGKGSMYEGGIRVPMMVRWPGKIRPGSICNTPVHAIDIYPTLLEIAGGHMEEDWIIDGTSILPLLEESGDISREALYWYMPLYDRSWGATPCAVIREGDFKLIEFFGDYCDRENDWEMIPEGRTELFDLSEDIGESRDISELYPERTFRMREALYSWINEMDAPLPVLNHRYDPERQWERTPFPLNFRPILETPFGDLTFQVGMHFEHVLNPEGFREYDDEPLNYGICIEGGERIPFWMEFDPETLTLSGKSDTPVEMTMEISAIDPQGEKATDQFKIIIQ